MVLELTFQPAYFSIEIFLNKHQAAGKQTMDTTRSNSLDTIMQCGVNSSRGFPGRAREHTTAHCDFDFDPGHRVCVWTILLHCACRIL